VVDVAAEGYAAQGNEFSYFMLLASAYILNAAAAEEGAPPAIIHPYVLTASNVAADADQLRGLAVPSPPPAALLPAPGLLSMVAGDFCEVYARRDAAGSFDGVVTAFFIDTVPNVATAIDVVAHVLRRGGVWINAGPLLYHWADAHAYLDDAPASVEVCLEDVLKLVAAAGFDIVKQSTADAPFNADPRSMARHGYRVAEWTAVKRGG
jgi:carnosine N-methyltransferase